MSDMDVSFVGGAPKADTPIRITVSVAEGQGKGRMSINAEETVGSLGIDVAAAGGTAPQWPATQIANAAQAGNSGLVKQLTEAYEKAAAKWKQNSGGVQIVDLVKNAVIKYLCDFHNCSLEDVTGKAYLKTDQVNVQLALNGGQVFLVTTAAVWG